MPVGGIPAQCRGMDHHQPTVPASAPPAGGLAALGAPVESGVVAVATFIAVLFSAIAFAGVLSLVALGFVVLYRATRIINFAHGDLMTAGGYVAFFFINEVGLPIFAAYGVTIAMLFLAGVALERLAYAPLRRASDIAVVLATLGIAIAIRAGLGIWQGTTPKNLVSPFGSAVVHVGGANISEQRLMIVVVVLVVIGALVLFFQGTQFGRQMRSLATDREMAMLVGVRVNGMATLAFGISSGLAGLAGVLISPLVAVDLNLGFNVMLLAFSAAVLGGFGSLTGILVASLVVGLTQQVIGNYVLQNYADVLPFVMMLAVIVLRPQGLFAGLSGWRV